MHKKVIERRYLDNFLRRMGWEPELLSIQDSETPDFVIKAEKVISIELTKLIDMSERPHVTIEVVPFSAGLHRGMAENFNILEFEDPTDDDVLYFESARDSLFSHDEAGEVIVYRELFEDLRSVSLNPKGTLDYLTRTIEAIT